MNLQGRNLQQNLTGDDVRLLHTELGLLNPPFIIPETERQPGLFGPATLAAVQNFQKAHSITVTGIVDAATAAAINAEVDAQVPPVVKVASIQLSFGTTGNDVARIQDALATLGRSLPADETAARVLGPGTTAVIKALQQESGLPVTGTVDASTLAIVNSRLAQLVSAARTVRGTVVNADGNPVKGLTVTAYLHGPAGQIPAGKPVITAADGSYVLSYIRTPGSRADLSVQVSYIINGVAGPIVVVAEAIPSAATILTNAAPLEVVNFTLTGSTSVPQTEYERILSDVSQLLGNRAIASLTENDTQHDVSLLAVQAGYTSDQIAAVVASNQLAASAGVPAPVLYGLFRGGLTSNLTALRVAHPDTRAKALQSSIDRGLVPATLDGKNTQNLIAGLTPASLQPLAGLLGGSLNTTDFATFAGLYSKNTQDPDAFWAQVAADPVLGARAAKLRFTIQVATLVNNHQPLVTAVSALPGIAQASDLVHITEDKWKSLIQSVGVPADTPGATPEEKSNNYMQQILVQVEAAFPTAFFAERLPASPVKTFLQAQPSFDLISTYASEFFRKNPAAANSLAPQDRGLLASYQRLRRLGNTNEALALLPHARSAEQISRMDRQTFLSRLNGAVVPDRANEIYDQALRTSAIATALRAENGAANNRTSLHVLPRLDVAKQAALAADSIPDWQTLFGSFDFCTCEDCTSAHSPAAYFVDILSFLVDRPGLGSNSVQDMLFARRPDLGDIELSCENTNTPVSLIDLANEILEDAIAPPALFTPFTLPAAIEPDLGLTAATDALRQAFTPPLGRGARVEVLEAGARWRVWDERFAHSVSKNGNVLNVTARSRQTSGSAADLRATPQYRNSAAYAETGSAVFPWSLPFDLQFEEARTFLNSMNVPRQDLIAALRPTPNPFVATAPVVISIAAERLGITDTVRKILVGEALTPPRQPADFWGSATVITLSTVQEMLIRSGLTYAELDSLIATWFVNPAGALSISATSGAAIDTCDTAHLQINGLTADAADRLHRFARLWRALGWTIAETDRALRVFAPNATTPSMTNELLVRLDHLSTLSVSLRISVVQALAFFAPIDTREPGSLYQSLFYNPAVFRPQDDAFRLRADGQDLADTSKQLGSFASTLQAAFRLNATDAVESLIAKTDGRLNLVNLSLIYRHALLARQLGIAVQDLLTAIDLTGLNPFDSAHSEQAVRFLDVVKTIQGSGFGIPQIDYLLRQRFNPPVPFVPLDSEMAQMLTDIRGALLANNSTSDNVIDRIAAALGLSADVAGSLAGRVIHSGKTALQHFIALAAIDLTPQASTLTRQIAQTQFEALEKLLKIASIIQILDLPGSQLDWLFRENAWLATAPDPPASPVLLAGWYSLIQLQQLKKNRSLEKGAVEAILGALGGSRQTLIDALSKWLGWSADDLATLIGDPGGTTDGGLLQTNFPGDSRLDLVVRISRAIAVSKALGVSAAAANQWCNATVADSDAKAIRAAAKARYDENAWLKIVTPLQNSLRDKQREALVSYLVSRPASWNPQLTQADASDLFDHFLIDVEMSSCQLTSRIKQAISSVQLFAQRCLMGLEPGIPVSDPKWTRWSWMKNYRVWEANRKIWLYPENWIEPELRDNKTPFFKDLENELFQSDLGNAAAEQALSRYLKKLDDVSRLEIAGVYEDDDKDLHVFGRTFNTPRAYYYRRRDGGTLSWIPWESVELDIEGDHLIPVMWNRKLLLIWPIFTDKVLPKPITMPPPGGTLESGDHYWSIQLAWSEYQYGKWSGKFVSDVITFQAYEGEDNVVFGPAVSRAIVIARAKDGTVVNNGGGAGGNGGGGNGRGTAPPAPLPPVGSTSTRQLVPIEMICFKGLATGDTLAVRAYLRRDYRAAHQSGDEQIAYPFGEFVFSGCRKIVTTLPNSQFARRNFALAPKGTKFDRMWFTATSSGLTMFDGTFPVFPQILLPVIAQNVPSSIAGDPSSTLANKLDIPVLDEGAGFRLLTPHQDLQFVGDRPFFFEDSQRAFIVTSTGTSGKTPRRGWIAGNVATTQRADYFASPVPPPPSPGPVTEPAAFTVLVPGAVGQRIARELPPITVSPLVDARTLVPTFWTTRQYTFANFHHPYVCDFGTALNQRGFRALFSVATQSLTNAASFSGYQPEARVTTPVPVDEVEFESGRAYEVYNWELFFHVPLLIATRLSQNQQFEDAQRWFHYIFDPTASSDEPVPQKYWNTLPFHQRLAGDYEAESAKKIEIMAASGPSNELEAAVEQWRSNPFDPDSVARLRTTAYQKAVVMKYIDNVIAWGDQLFRANTLETINEATQLYVLAAEILGRRPEVIERSLKPAVQTFRTLLPDGPLGNAMEQIELLIPQAGGSASLADSQAPDPPSGTMLYFCVPENDRLLGYWDTLADRLFKIRHCMNIEGQVQQLPLFEPPIDPALLVRARAAGLSIGEVLSDTAIAALPNQRFSIMLQKANEIAAEVRSLGSQLLSVLEKNDGEGLATMRAGQELRLLQSVRGVRARQVDEAAAAVAGLQVSSDIAQARKDYYESRAKISDKEQTAVDLATNAAGQLESQSDAEFVSIILALLPDVKIGSPTTDGVTYGGSNIIASLNTYSNRLGTESQIKSSHGGLSARQAEFDRRKEEWDFQANLATLELKQVDKQLAAAQIRHDMATRDLANHDQQIEDAGNVDQFLRTKYTNQELFQWMVGQVSGIYFQSYQLAYDLAKRAEMCMQHELGLAYGETSLIHFGHWDSLRKGLLAGDRLGYDLKRLENAYLEGNRREYELTKHFSLISLAPAQLIALKETGSCQFDVPEWLFDLDTPGHYMRRIRMLSVTIPCVTGPYTTIHAKLTLVKSSYRRSADVAQGYARVADGTDSDARFIVDRKISDTIVTSTGQTDPGLFEPSFKDERYLPFEGAGAETTWMLELPMDFKTFDYASISDVILHMRYTARDGGSPLKAAARASAIATAKTGQPLQRLFSLRHEFPTEWQRLVNSPAVPATMLLNLAPSRFPYFAQGKTIGVQEAQVLARAAAGGSMPATIAPGANPQDLSKTTWTDPATAGPWTISIGSGSAGIGEIFVILTYTLT
jgi:peptidoglycan hydrolase-like protein with peptidoglycan-binding domain